MWLCSVSVNIVEGAADVNSLHVEVIYTFQFSKVEIARNQHCHSEGRS